MPDSATMQRPTAPQSQQLQEHIPTRGQLVSWWKQFKKNARGGEERAEPPPPPANGVLGVPLATSIRYANVAISLFDNDGRSFIYDYVPIVVAKCGVYLKEKATEVEGIFRLAGAERRIKELLVIFNSPDRYGKGLDWTGYTVHDAANVLRRYLNKLPEPIIPLTFYDRFREPLRHHQAEAVGQMEQQREPQGDFDHEGTIRIYQQLITELPPLNRQLLLYILDLLAVFCSKAHINLMTAPNLSLIFQPGLISHPSHDMLPEEYRLSQDVLIFLIENQDNFLVGMQGTAADAKTIQDVQSGPSSVKTPTTPAGRTQQIARSSSTASAGSESVRKYGSVRRNVSVNSRNSRQSNNSPGPADKPQGSPLTPTSKGSGIHRSNTVPSKKSNSPALAAAERFHASRMNESPAGLIVSEPEEPDATETPISSDVNITPPKPRVPSPQRSPRLSAWGMRKGRSPTPVAERREELRAEKPDIDTTVSSGPTSPVLTPSKERGFSSFFRTSPSTERERSEGRKPNKLQKRRTPEELAAASNPQVSPSGGSYPPSPGLPLNLASMRSSHSNLDVPPTESLSKPPLNTNNSFHSALEGPKSPTQSPPPPEAGEGLDRGSAQALAKPIDPADTTALTEVPQPVPVSTLKPGHSPTGSVTSRSTGAELSSVENEEAEGSKEKKEARHHRWKLSMSSKRHEEKLNNDTNTLTTGLGSAVGAEKSNSSVASINKSGKTVGEDTSRSGSLGQSASTIDAEDRSIGDSSLEKRGPLGWFRGKWHERKEKEAERERAKSPPPAPIAEEPAPEQSLNAAASTQPLPPTQSSEASPIPIPQNTDGAAPALTPSQPEPPAQPADELGSDVPSIPGGSSSEESTGSNTKAVQEQQQQTNTTTVPLG